VKDLEETLEAESFYRLNGNTLGNHYSLTKLLWTRDHQPKLYEETYKFLLWGSFVPFMLGCEPAVDFSLANRTLLFDLDQETWSAYLLQISSLDPSKFPKTVPSGTVIGTVSAKMAAELSLPPHIPIVAGSHDQCANAVGCGVIKEGLAMYGMGTFICAVPVFSERKEPQIMLAQGLNTEHHAVPGKFVSFIYNDGGSLFKWFRNTFAQTDKIVAEKGGRDIYADLIAEMPSEPGQVMVLPHFSTTGPPHFIADSCGFMAGLKLETTRGDILKGILEGVTFYIRECMDALPAAGIEISDFRVVGGGSKSDAWIQISADIMGRPFIRPKITEAGALGAAIMAGVGCGVFRSFQEGVDTMVRLDQTYEPDLKKHDLYQKRFEQYKKAWPLLQTYLRELATKEQ
jgi:xylulokinase